MTFPPSALINELLTDFAGVPSSYIPSDDWTAEDNAFLSINYILLVAEPTSVNEIIGRLLEQAGAIMWWDDLDQLIHYQILREISTTAQSYDEDNVLANTMQVTEQPVRRVSQVIIYYNKINPLLNDEPQSYASMHTETDTDSEFTEGPAVKTIFANYVFDGGDAQTIAQRHLSRHVKPPRRFNFEVMRFSVPEDPHLGVGARIGGGDPSVPSWPFSIDATGERIDIPVQITRHSALMDKHIVEAEELNFTLFGTQPLNKVIVLDEDQNHFNLRDAHDDLYGDPFSGDTVTCIINQGVIIGAWSISHPAFDVGTWPAGVTVTVSVRGRIEGKGGHGGNYQTPGSAGGVALYTRKAISLILNVGTGQIWGGAGGGAGGSSRGGGGGAGQRPGSGGDGSFDGAQGDDGTDRIRWRGWSWRYDCRCRWRQSGFSWW